MYIICIYVFFILFYWIGACCVQNLCTLYICFSLFISVSYFSSHSDESKTPPLPRITSQQCTVTSFCEGRVLVNDVTSRIQSTPPYVEGSKTSFHEELDGEKCC